MSILPAILNIHQSVPQAFPSTQNDSATQNVISLTLVFSLGFTKVCTIEDVQKAYPLLDMVDHENRNAVAKGNHPDDDSFSPIEGKDVYFIYLFIFLFWCFTVLLELKLPDECTLCAKYGNKKCKICEPAVQYIGNMRILLSHLCIYTS